jgi:hypothetical protein
MKIDSQTVKGDDTRTCPPLPARLPLSGIDSRTRLRIDLGRVARGVGRRVEARSSIQDARVSSFKRQASIRASTTINEILFSY